MNYSSVLEHATRFFTMTLLSVMPFLNITFSPFPCSFFFHYWKFYLLYNAHFQCYLFLHCSFPQCPQLDLIIFVYVPLMSYAVPLHAHISLPSYVMYSSLDGRIFGSNKRIWAFLVASNRNSTQISLS